jgi:hypothetical protein
LDIKIEKENLFTKEVTASSASPEWYRTITSILEELQSSHGATRSEFEVKRRLHFDPLMDADMNTVDKLCTSVGMFKLDGEEAPPCDLFAKAPSLSGTNPNKFWEMADSIKRSVDKSSFCVVGVLQERVLGVRATKFKQDLAVTIGCEAVPVHVKEGHTNPAHVFSYATGSDVEGTPEGAVEGAVELSTHSEETFERKVPEKFTRISQLSSVRAGAYSAQCTLEYPLEVQEYASAYLGASGIQKYLREVPQCEGEAYVLEFVVKLLSGSDLLLEGLKVSVTDLEACKLAELDWMAIAAARTGTPEESSAAKATLEKYIAACKEKAEGRCKESRKHGAMAGCTKADSN